MSSSGYSAVYSYRDRKFLHFVSLAMTLLTLDFISVLFLCENVFAGVVITASDKEIFLFLSTAAAALVTPAVITASSVIGEWAMVTPPAVVTTSSVAGGCGGMVFSRSRCLGIARPSL